MKKKVQVRPWENTKLLFLVAVTLYGLIIALNWNYTWDDSAITLAFSKTFAFSGEIKPTPLSDKVDGYSTFLWMIIMSLPFKLGLSADTVLNFAKIISSLLNIANAIILSSIIKRWLHTDKTAVWTGLVFLFSSVSLSESLNGMENPLYVMLLLVSVYVYCHGTAWYHRLTFILATVSIILIRFEGPFFLLPFVVCDMWKHRSRFYRQGHYVAWILVFICYHLWHHSYFGAWLPNTILAKQKTYLVPLSEGIVPFVLYHLKPVIKLILSYSGLIVMMFFIWLQRKTPFKCRQSECCFMSSLCMFGAGLIFNLIIGNNSGPMNRMFFPFIPFLLLCGAFYFNMSNSIHTRVLVFFLVVFFITQFYVFAGEVSSHITVRHYRRTAEALEQLRNLMDRDNLVFAGPDMGGLLLYSTHLRVIDIGLLCNAYLARRGYQAFSDLIFYRERPDVIEIHTMWTEKTKIAGFPVFYQMYQPLWMEDMRFFVRNDLMESLLNKELVVRVPFQEDKSTAGRESDFMLNRQFGFYYQFFNGKSF
jgi:hypothetical protein